MIGYHYTTMEAWAQIKHQGMHLSTMGGVEYDNLSRSLPGLQRKVIWVWTRLLTNHQAFISCILIADAFNTFDIALLKIHYPESHSASNVYKDAPMDEVRLTCRISAGRMEANPPIDLIISSVPASEIELLWNVNLLLAMDNRHTKESAENSI